MFTLIAQVIGKGGVGGVFLLMLLENLIPIIPSELILPMAGFAAARGQMSPLAAILAGAAGSSLGGLVWYGIGRRIGPERLQRWAARGGRWFALSPTEIAHATTWFQRRGALALLIGRTLPGVRAVICIPAGVAKMPVGRFLFWSTLGALIWSTLLVGAGLLLNAHYDQVERWVNPLSDAVLAAAGGLYLYRVATFRR